MKITKQKRTKKIISLYKNYFGFHAPYHFLVDGSFCHSALENKVNIRDQIPKFLNREVKLFTTVCAIRETELLGSNLYGAMLIIKKFQVHKCGHEKNPVSVPNCFRHMVRDNNSNHYFVATQDYNLRSELRKIPGVPIVYLFQSTAILENLSESSEEVVRNELEKSLNPSEYQMKVLNDLKGEPSEEKTKMRRKRKKGLPNPLSCKKKKVKPQPEQSQHKKKRKPRFRLKIPKHVKELRKSV